MKINSDLKRELSHYLREKLAKDKKKVVVVSPYPLSVEEMGMFTRSIPLIKNSELVNEVDKNLLSGIIIKFGTKMIDLSLNSRLQILKNVMYETL